MNRYLHIGLFLMICAVAASAVQADSSPEERFSNAGRAYDAEQYPEAIAQYEQLLADGYRAPELYFNLANAYFRAGDVGRAVLHYKKAEQLAPRDPHIQHNLQFALTQADAAHAPYPWPARWLRLLSLAEWAAVAAVAWWLAAIYLCVALWPTGRRGGGISASFAVLFLLISIAGIYHWLSLRIRPETVIVKPGQEALFAPLQGATAHFTLPPGSIARVDSFMEDWYKVSVGDKDGWIRRSAATPVAPWDSSREEGPGE